MWHKFCYVAQMCGDFVSKLEVAKRPFCLLPAVQAAKWKRVKMFLARLERALTVARSCELDIYVLPKIFDILPKHIVNTIVKMRLGRKTFYGRVHHEF